MALAYILLTSGIVVDIHYCMGKLSSVDFQKSASNTCGKCGMSNRHCCNDEIKVVKLEDSHQQAEGLSGLEMTGIPSFILPPELQVSFAYTGPALALNRHLPPDLPPATALPLLCVFRI